MHKANIHVLDILNALKAVSSRPFVAHKYPNLQREGFVVVGEKLGQVYPKEPKLYCTGLVFLAIFSITSLRLLAPISDFFSSSHLIAV